MIRVLVLFIMLAGCKSLQTSSSKEFQPDPIIFGAEEQPQTYQLNLDVVNEINTKRIGKNLPKVAVDTSLVCAAENHAKFIGKLRICTHTGSNYSTFWQRAKKCGYRGNGGGEIIACGHRNAAEAVKGWIASPGHNRIMFGNYKAIGCDMVNNFWVCVFGS
jgi:uncharacterized protein YkwD